MVKTRHEEKGENDTMMTKGFVSFLVRSEGRGSNGHARGLLDVEPAKAGAACVAGRRGWARPVALAAALAVGACESAPSPRAPGPRPDVEGKTSGPPNLPPGVVPFVGEAPMRIQGEDPTCTVNAIRRRAQGKVVAVCIVTVEGILEQCSVIKDTAGLGDEVLQVLPSWRFTPARQCGEPIPVKLGVPFTFRCHRPAP